MSMFDQLMQQAQGLDLNAVAQKVGLTPEQVQTAARALLPQIADPNADNGQATAAVASQTGLSADKLAAMVPALLQQAQGLGASGGAFGSVLAGLGGSNATPGAPQGGLDLGGIARSLDKDGDGNPLDDVLGMFNRR